MNKAILPDAYALFDIETTRSLQDLCIGPEDTGIAIILRRKGKPVGFIMKPMNPGSGLGPEQIARLIAREAGEIFLTESIREEMGETPLPTSLPSVTVAVCTRNRPELLKRCLDSLYHLSFPAHFHPNTMEVLVVDNAPPDNKTLRTTELLSGRLPSLRYVKEEKPGLDFARNRAILEASGEILVYLDDDATADTEWLSGLLEAWAENPDAGCFTGLVLPYKLETRAQVLFEQRGGFRRGFRKIRYGLTLREDPLYPCGPGIFGTGSNMAFQKSALTALGGFDEALDTGAPLPGGGDLDIFYRIIRAGYPLVYEPRFMVFHEHRREFNALQRQLYAWGLGLMTFLWKSYKENPSQRTRFRRLVRWWLTDHFKRLVKSILRPRIFPPTLVLAEAWGGIIGLLGEYPRSINRINRIKNQLRSSP